MHLDTISGILSYPSILKCLRTDSVFKPYNIKALAFWFPSWSESLFHLYFTTVLQVQNPNVSNWLITLLYSECYAPHQKAQYTSKATVGPCWSECAVRSCNSHQHFTAKTMKLDSKVHSQNKEKFRLVITQCEAWDNCQHSYNPDCTLQADGSNGRSL